MGRGALLLLLLVAAVPLALPARGDPAPGEKELLGMRLFNQSCRVCHIKPQITSPQYAPALSRESLGGDPATMREVISNGTPRMPGFKFNFEPEQIDAIVAYLKTLPAPSAPR